MPTSAMRPGANERLRRLEGEQSSVERKHDGKHQRQRDQKHNALARFNQRWPQPGMAHAARQISTCVARSDCCSRVTATATVYRTPRDSPQVSGNNGRHRCRNCRTKYGARYRAHDVRRHLARHPFPGQRQNGQPRGHDHDSCHVRRARDRSVRYRRRRPSAEPYRKGPQ